MEPMINNGDNRKEKRIISEPTPVDLWNDAIFVGTICDVFQKSFVINSIDAETNDDGKMKIKFSSVRYIKIYTDYLNSLSLYIKWKEKLERPVHHDMLSAERENCN